MQQLRPLFIKAANYNAFNSHTLWRSENSKGSLTRAASVVAPNILVEEKIDC